MNTRYCNQVSLFLTRKFISKTTNYTQRFIGKKQTNFFPYYFRTPYIIEKQHTLWSRFKDKNTIPYGHVLKSKTHMFNEWTCAFWILKLEMLYPKDFNMKLSNSKDNHHNRILSSCIGYSKICSSPLQLGHWWAGKRPFLKVYLT